MSPHILAVPWNGLEIESNEEVTGMGTIGDVNLRAVTVGNLVEVVA